MPPTRQPASTRRRRPHPRARLAWSLRILTFGVHLPTGAVALPGKYHRHSPRLSDQPARVLAAGFRGAVIAAEMSMRDGHSRDHRCALVRLQTLFAEAVRRDPRAGKHVVVATDHDPLEGMTHAQTCEESR